MVADLKRAIAEEERANLEAYRAFTVRELASSRQAFEEQHRAETERLREEWGEKWEAEKAAKRE